jgi:hypothetical protein
MDRRIGWIVGSFAVAFAFLIGHQLFGTAWSNKCDPGNAQFFLMKNDPVVTFRPSGELFTWENDGPDNGWLCSDASLSVSHVGPDVKSIFAQTRADMAASGWTGGEIFLKDQDFAVYSKTINGVRIDAVLQSQPMWVEVDMNAPGLHPGEYGFSR